jgi:hypothetical protein
VLWCLVVKSVSFAYYSIYQMGQIDTDQANEYFSKLTYTMYRVSDPPSGSLCAVR